jgi:hypothetical protein
MFSFVFIKINALKYEFGSGPGPGLPLLLTTFYSDTLFVQKLTMFIARFSHVKQNVKKNSFYTKYRQYKFSKLVKVVTRAKAKFSINR